MSKTADVSERNAFAQKGGVKTLSKSELKRIALEKELGITLRRQNYITADLVLAEGAVMKVDKKDGQKVVDIAESMAKNKRFESALERKVAEIKERS